MRNNEQKLRRRGDGVKCCGCIVIGPLLDSFIVDRYGVGRRCGVGRGLGVGRSLGVGEGWV